MGWGGHHHTPCGGSAISPQFQDREKDHLQKADEELLQQEGSGLQSFQILVVDQIERGWLVEVMAVGEEKPASVDFHQLFGDFILNFKPRRRRLFNSSFPISDCIGLDLRVERVLELQLSSSWKVSSPSVRIRRNLWRSDCFNGRQKRSCKNLINKFVQFVLLIR